MTTDSRRVLFQTILYLILSVGLSVPLFQYYTDYHRPWLFLMNVDTAKLWGQDAYLASLVAAASVVYLLWLVWLTVPDWPDLFRPTRSVVIMAILVFLLAPWASIAIPLPSGLILLVASASGASSIIIAIGWRSPMP